MNGPVTLNQDLPLLKNWNHSLWPFAPSEQRWLGLPIWGESCSFCTRGEQVCLQPRIKQNWWQALSQESFIPWITAFLGLFGDSSVCLPRQELLLTLNLLIWTCSHNRDLYNLRTSELEATLWITEWSPCQGSTVGIVMYYCFDWNFSTIWVFHFSIFHFSELNFYLFI